MKKIIYIILVALLIGGMNYLLITSSVEHEYRSVEKQYAALEYNLTARPLTYSDSYYSNRLFVEPVRISDDQDQEQEISIVHGSGRITAVSGDPTSTDFDYDGIYSYTVVTLNRLDMTVDDGTGYDEHYYAYYETDFTFNDGDRRVLRVDDEITFDYYINSHGERVLTQVTDDRDPVVTARKLSEREAQIQADKHNAKVSVILKSLLPVFIEIGLFTGLYFILKKLKSNPENSWKKVYVISSVLILLALNICSYIFFVSQDIFLNGSRLRCALPDAVYPSLTVSIAVDLIFAVFASLIFMLIAMKKKDKSIIGAIIFIFVTGALIVFLYLSIQSYMERARNAAVSVRAHAPIIYLYNDEDESINVRLDLDGELDVTYPEYNDGFGWNVTASSDGTLTDEDGNTYPFLFWEATLNMDYDLSRGFCVKGSDTEEFLNEALDELGLNETEASDFMSYWLPLMEGNEYNVITFQTTAYEDAAGLLVTPAPDVTVRINMLWYESSEYVEMEPQELEGMNPALNDREGFTLVEWGGEMITP